MSDLFDKKVAAHAMKQNVVKEDFGWEIPVESVPLPTRGLLYSPDSTLYNRETVPIKAMTAHEEDILSSQALIKEGTVITNLIRSCVTDKSFGVNDLTLGDRNALMMAIRITGYGHEYKFSLECEACGVRNNAISNLTDLGINRLNIEPVTQGKNEFVYTLPVSKKKVHFKFLTMKDEVDRSALAKVNQTALDVKIEKNVTSYLKQAIVQIDGIRDKNKINQFIEVMPAFDSRSIRNYIRSHEPGIDMSIQHKCDKCGHHNEAQLPMTSEFFWPST